jgi:hypothetical protein
MKLLIEFGLLLLLLLKVVVSTQLIKENSPAGRVARLSLGGPEERVKPV